MNIDFMPIEGSDELIRFIALDNGVKKDGVILKEPVDTMYDRAKLAAESFDPVEEKPGYTLTEVRQYGRTQIRFRDLK